MTTTTAPGPLHAPASQAADPLAAYRIEEEPFYRPSGREVQLYRQAYQHRMPLAVRHGGICYLDEVVEARQDTTVVIHPLTDARRALPLDKKGEVVHAHPDFQLVVSYNPGYQSSAKDMKPSTRQRFAALDFDYPAPGIEAEIVARETGIDPATAHGLVSLARSTRELRHRGLDEGASTRMLIYAGLLMRDGVSVQDSCDMTITRALTDDPDTAAALRQLVEAEFGT
jgi:nitric oxide reductase NorQ protein